MILLIKRSIKLPCSFQTIFNNLIYQLQEAIIIEIYHFCRSTINLFTFIIQELNMKKGFDSIKRQEQFSIQIRASKRNEAFKRKRLVEFNEAIQEEQMPNDKKIVVVDQSIRDFVQKLNMTEYKQEELMHLITLVFKQEDPEGMYRGIIGIRKVLSSIKHPPLQKCMDLGMVARLIQLINQTKHLQLKYEAAHSLALVSSYSSEICKLLVEKGAMRAFVDLLKNNIEKLKEQGIWGIGNIAADKISYRDKLREMGALKLIIDIVEKTTNKNLIRNGCWAISNLCRGFPTPPFTQIKDSIRILAAAITQGFFQGEKNSILNDCYWTICYLTENGKKSEIKYLLENANLDIFVRELKSQNSKISLACLRILGNISMGDKAQLQNLIDIDFIGLALNYLLAHQAKEMRKQTMWTLSNIAGGSCKQVAQLIQNPQIIDKILELFKADVPEIKKECCWVFANMCYSGDRQTVLRILFQRQVIVYFIEMLSEKQEEILDHALCCLEKILDFGEKHKQNDVNLLLRALELNGGYPKLQQLQYHELDIVYKKAARICQKYSGEVSQESRMDQENLL